jgi:hypothetical protein
VGEAKLGEHRASSGKAKVFHEILPEKPHGHGVEQERALPSETDHATLSVQFQELLVMQILDAHSPPLSF